MTEEKEAVAFVSRLPFHVSRLLPTGVGINTIFSSTKKQNRKQCIDMNQVRALIFINAISYHVSMAQGRMPGSFALSIKTKQRLISPKILLRIARIMEWFS